MNLKRKSKDIQLSDYKPHIEALKHIFLVGNLPRRPSYPFVNDPRLEIILCHYQAGDDGEYHWHRDITEYDLIIEGKIGYKNMEDGKTKWYEPGDLCVIEPGICVKRLVEKPSRSVTVKVPSLADDKIICDTCQRSCRFKK